jgi:hypothetical protein
LDTSFGSNGTGRAEYSFDGVNAAASAMAVQPDGKLLIAGTAHPVGQRWRRRHS